MAPASSSCGDTHRAVRWNPTMRWYLLGRQNDTLQTKKIYRRTRRPLCHSCPMSLSGQQHRLVRRLKAGFHLRIVRSVLRQSPVYCELLSAQAQEAVEVIPMWRIHKLLATRLVRLDTNDMSTAHEIVLLVNPD